MTFLAEWGDRSQLATIILAAKENVTAVIIAGILGHAFCTGLAVLGKTFYVYSQVPFKSAGTLNYFGRSFHRILEPNYFLLAYLMLHHSKN